MKDIANKITRLGLSAKAAEVYVALLQCEKPTGTTRLVRATGLHGQYVYDALSELEQRGLASHVVVGKRKKFAATHPNRLNGLVEQQKRLVTEVQHELDQFLRINHTQDFSLFQGEDAFVAHEFDELEAAKVGEEWLIIGGEGDKFIDIMGSRLKDYDAIRREKAIQMRYLGSDSQRLLLANVMRSRPHFKAKTLDGFGSSVVNTLIRPSKISLSTYAEPLLTYQVENQLVADSYRNFYEALWAKASQL